MASNDILKDFPTQCVSISDIFFYCFLYILMLCTNVVLMPGRDWFHIFPNDHSTADFSSSTSIILWTSCGPQFSVQVGQSLTSAALLRNKQEVIKQRNHVVINKIWNGTITVWLHFTGHMGHASGTFVTLNQACLFEGSRKVCRQGLLLGILQSSESFSESNFEW